LGRKRKFIERSPVAVDIFHLEFKVSHNFNSLLNSTYVVRSLIFECLKYKAETAQCSECSHRAAFELAFCYYVGLGTARDAELAREWADKTSFTMEDLDEEKEEVADIVIWHNIALKDLQLNGFTMVMDHVNEYCRPEYDISTVAAILRREIHDIDESIEDCPFLTASLRTILADVLVMHGDVQEAEKLYTDLLTLHQKGSKWTEAIRIRLSKAYRIGGRLSEAEELIRSVLVNTTGDDSGKSPLTISGLNVLGTVFFDAERWSEAVDIFEKLYNWTEEMFGQPECLAEDAVTNLACVYRQLGRLDEAEKLDLLAFEARKNLLDRGSSPHFKTVTSAANLALTFHFQKRHSEGEKLERWVLQQRLRQVGPMDPATLTAKKNLAITRDKLGQQKEAVSMLEEVVQAQKEQLGNEHPHTLASILDLAEIYREQGRSYLSQVLLRPLSNDAPLCHPMVQRYAQACARTGGGRAEKD